MYAYVCQYLGSSPVRWRISDVFVQQVVRNIEYDVFSFFSHEQNFGLITNRTRVSRKL